MSARRKSSAAPAECPERRGNQGVHQSVSNNQDVATIGRERLQSSSGSCRAPAGVQKALHAGRPSAEPRRSRDTGPDRGRKPERGPKRARQRGLANLFLNCRLRGGSQQPRRVARAPQRADNHEPSGLRPLLELGAWPRGGIERGITLHLEPGRESMTGDQGSRIQHGPAVPCQDDSCHRERFTRRPSHTANSAGRKTNNVSWRSWRESRPAGSPNGVHGNR